MHLFKNKNKDVKAFLEEMKANKTNRSSNFSMIDKKNNKSLGNDSQYHTASNGNLSKITQ